MLKKYALGALSAVCWMACFASTSSYVHSQKRMTQATEAIALAQDVKISLLDAETGARGFAVTGDEFFLQPYTHATVVLDDELVALRARVTDTPKHVDFLIVSAHDQMATLAEGVRLRRSGGIGEVLKSSNMLTYTGKQKMDNLRVEVANVVEGEQKVILQETERSSLISNVMLMSLIAAVMSFLTFIHRHPLLVKSGK